MKKGVIILAAILLIAAIAFVVVLKNSANVNETGNQNQEDSQDNSDVQTNDQNTIEIEGFAFTPSTLTINVGDEVTWINQDSAPHTITSDSGNELQSNSLSQGQSYSHTFDNIGAFDYSKPT